MAFVESRSYQQPAIGIIPLDTTSSSKVDYYNSKKHEKYHLGPSSSETSSSVIQVIEPGLVVIRDFISDDTCQQLASMALSIGDEEQGEDGFYTRGEEDGVRRLNTGENRGRIYDAITRFPNHVQEHCSEAVRIARNVDPEMPEMNCTHLLLNMYTTSEGLVWHRDIYENDGKSDHPVVNLCVGAACRFGFKHKDEDPDRVVKLRSGDCLLFGGPCRLIKHAVLEVLLDEYPIWMAENPVRFSFTYRDSPEVLGKESGFKYFRVKEHLVGQEEFDQEEQLHTNVINIRNRKGLPSQLSQSLTSYYYFI